jgi:hypothetical protein
MRSVTSCVGGGWFLCFTCLHVPYSTVTLITVLLAAVDLALITLAIQHTPCGIVYLDCIGSCSWRCAIVCTSR